MFAFTRHVIYYKAETPMDETNRPPDEITQQWLGAGCLLDSAPDIPNNFLVVEMPLRDQFHFATHEEVTGFIRKRMWESPVFRNTLLFMLSEVDELDMAKHGWIKMGRVGEALFDLFCMNLEEMTPDMEKEFEESSRQFQEGLADFVALRVTKEGDT